MIFFRGIPGIIKAIKAYLYHFFYDLRLKYKLITSFSVFILFPILLVGLTSYYISQKYLLDSEKNAVRYSMIQLNSTINYFLETYLNKSIMIYSNQDMQQALIKKNNDIADIVETHVKIHDIIHLITDDVRYTSLKNSNYYGGTVKIAVYVNNDSIRPNGEDIMSFSSIENEKWCRDLYASSLLYSWQTETVGKNKTGYIILNQKLINFVSLENLGILRIYIPVERINNIIEANMKNDNFNFIYLDDNSNIITYTGRKFKENSLLLETIRGLDLKYEMNEVTIRKERLLIGYNTSDVTGWRMMYISPVSIITDKVANIKIITIVTVIVSIMLCILIASFVSSLVTGRVEILVNKTNSIGKEGFKITGPMVPGNDEIGVLDRNFDRMLERINYLIETNYRSKMIVNQTKFELLQEQINPHLLYNTLSMIGMTARNISEKGIENVTNSLINFYKGILNKGRFISSIGSELGTVNNYIQIARFVYNLDIETIFDIDDKALDYYSIKLFLQPVVENAILHGIRPKKSGTLEIICKTMDKSVKFIVVDDGVGIHEDKLAQLQKNEGNFEKSFGLSNVKRRINLFFGNDYGLQINSTLFAGTVVEITLPLLDEKELSNLLESRYLV